MDTNTQVITLDFNEGALLARLLSQAVRSTFTKSPTALANLHSLYYRLSPISSDFVTKNCGLCDTPLINDNGTRYCEFAVTE